jgi:DNA (cytosine-5)-methyltransferase 1
MISGRGRQRSGKARKRTAGPTFIDLFAGCGGLSLGLFKAGWTGLFAVEKNPDAFSTLRHNLIDGDRHSYRWPKWLPKRASSTGTLLRSYGDHLAALKGRVDLIAGAPPCQGFSLAGRRTHADPRNKLFKQYLAIVRKIRPRFVLLENVQGFCLPFKKGHKRHPERYSDVLIQRLESMGYTVFFEVVDFSKFGVPQSRNRFVLVGIRSTDPVAERLKRKPVFKRLQDRRMSFLQSKRLSPHRVVSAKQAIADLESTGKKLIPCPDPRSKRFMQISYDKPPAATAFASLMRKGFADAPTSMRLAAHRPKTILQFARILDTCRRGRSLSKQDRKRLRIKKQALTPLDAKRPSSTITTLPDDIVHYAEPRILTVRENARLQTFPDWYEFKGNYTTGGHERVDACPRYTQVGNAVPPLFSEAIGAVLKSLVA